MKTKRLAVFLLAISVLTLIMTLCTTSRQSEPQPELYHMVFFWLSNPNDTTAMNALYQNTMAFSNIPGVIDIVVGSVVQSERSVVEDSYDLGVIISFTTIKAYNDYLKNPEHVKAEDIALHEYVKKVRVMNINNGF